MSDDYFGDAKSAFSRDIKIIFEQTLVDLTEGKTLSLEEKGTVIDQLHKPSGKEEFAEVLSNITNQTEIQPLEAFKTLGELVNYLLTSLVMEKKFDTQILSIVLNVSRNVYTTVKN